MEVLYLCREVFIQWTIFINLLTCHRLLTESQCIIHLTTDLDFLHPPSFLSDISNGQLEFFIQAHLTVQSQLILAICFCSPFPTKLHVKISTKVIKKVRVAQNYIFLKQDLLSL